MRRDYNDLANNRMEEFDRQCGNLDVKNFPYAVDWCWFLLAKTALWGLFALVEAVGNLSIQLHD